VLACADGSLIQPLSSLEERVIKRETTKTLKHQSVSPHSAVDCYDVKTLKPHVIAGHQEHKAFRCVPGAADPCQCWPAL